MRYTIKKGCHYSWPLFKAKFDILHTDYRQYARAFIKFNKTNIYDFHGNPKQFDVNKLFGFSQGHHHNNSVRAGWYYNTDDCKIHICYYAYENGMNLENGLWKDICPVDLNKTYAVIITSERLKLEDCNNACTSDVFDKIEIYDNDTDKLVGSYAHIRQDVNTNFKIGYYLTPYFGGTMKCPHDMYIDFKWID